MTKSKSSKSKPISNRANIDIAFTNIRGLSSNFESVEEYVLNASPHMLALCETGLDSNDMTGHLYIPGYSPIIAKHDHLNRHGHGLGVYVKEGFPCGRDLSHEDANSPYMCFRIALLHSTAFIFVLYRPQDDGCQVFESIASQIDKIQLDYPSANIHVCGDFNVHHKEWLVHSNKTDPEGRHCHDFSVAYELTQIIDAPTRVPDVAGHYPNLLDLFLTSCPDRCTHTVSSPRGRSDHCMVSVSINVQCKKSSDAPFHRTVYRYSKANWDEFRSFMADAPLKHFFKFKVSKAASLITDWVLAGIENFIPHKKYQQKPNSQPWFTPECAAAIAHRNHFFHLYHRNRCDETSAAFRTARNNCHRVLSEAKDAYALSIQARIDQEQLGSREFWRITNKVLNRGKSPIPAIINDPEVLSSSSDKAELFAKIFSVNSTLDDSNNPLPDFPPQTANSISSFKITVKEVSRLIRDLDSSKATGPDEIPVVVLKNISPEISPILTKLFNRCLKEKSFPSSWKTSSVCPVFKGSGERSDPSKYRPISLLCIISKLFESVLNRHIMKYLNAHSLLSDVQYGFRSSRSTADVLTVISHRISEALDSSFEGRVIALDISKAFDQVWHRGLLRKLTSYGISGRLYSTLRSFLLGRKMRVVVNGQKSDVFEINAGVPQGSVLGPTLFLLFINDLPADVLKSFINIFADDTTIYGFTSKDLNHQDLADNISGDLSGVVQWGKRWLVSFNAQKTKLVSFNRRRNAPDLPPVSMDGVDLDESSCLDKLLGLKFSSDLKWNAYIASIAKDAARMVGSFYRSRKYLTPSALLYLYKSQIRLKMEYCCHLWAGCSQHALSSLDKIQNRMRGLVGDELFASLQPLSHRRNVASLSLFYRYFQGKCSEELHSLVPKKREFTIPTRFSETCELHPHFLELSMARTEFHSKSFFPRVAAMWNSLPPTCFPANYDLDIFKFRVNRHLSQS